MVKFYDINLEHCKYYYLMNSDGNRFTKIVVGYYFDYTYIHNKLLLIN